MCRSTIFRTKITAHFSAEAKQTTHGPTYPARVCAGLVQLHTSLFFM